MNCGQYSIFDEMEKKNAPWEALHLIRLELILSFNIITFSKCLPNWGVLKHAHKTQTFQRAGSQETLALSQIYICILKSPSSLGLEFFICEIHERNSCLSLRF